MVTKTNQRTLGQVGQPYPPLALKTYEFETETNISPMKWTFDRTSVGAILAGVVVSLVIMFAMSILGVAIGATTFDALIDFDADPIFDLETGVIIWIAVTNLVALFCGGWVAGRLAGVPSETDGTIHGIIVWGVVTLVSLWLFTTTVGRFMTATANAVGDSFNIIDNGVAAVVPGAIEAIEQRDLTRESIRDDIRNLAEDTDNPNLSSDEIEEDLDEAEVIIEDAAEDIAQDPSSASAIITSAVDRLLELDTISELDRQDVVNVIVANTDLTEEEANEAIIEWVQLYNDIDVDTEEILQNVEDDVTEAITQAAGLLFMTLAIGAIAGGAGGFVGAPMQPLVTADVVEVEEVNTDNPN
jgi:hypothetical protein